MKVLLASSEVHPYSKTGGLADMTGALAKSLARAGADVVMVTPLYKGIKERFPDLRHIPYSIDVPMGSRHMHADVYRHSPLPHLQILFVDQPAYFHRNELYQEHGIDYADNAARFLFFSKCVVHLARHLPLHPQVLHLHDWQVGLVPLLVRHQTWKEGWGNPPATVFTLHNLAYQGLFPPTEFQLANLPWDYWQPGVEFYGSMNCLKAGIHHADTITTVSPRYAREILTEAFGFGLDGVLRHREDDLVGILNGVDYDEWKTEGNPFLRHSFNAKNLRGKALEKAALQKELGLPVQPHTPLFGNISRLVDQKGSDLILGAMEEMLSNDLQYIQLGSGMPELEEGFLQLAKRYPNKVATHIGYDAALAHRIEAGSDFFLMPSRYEPCGLNQLYSMRYGTIPVVRSTGGLDDAVTDVTEDPKKANGIEFRDATASSLANAVRKALALYAAPRALRSFRQRAMAMDFSWEETAQQYLRIYRRASGLEG